MSSPTAAHPELLWMGSARSRSVDTSTGWGKFLYDDGDTPPVPETLAWAFHQYLTPSPGLVEGFM
ncbi:MAG: hypothetical protein QM705_11025 [Ancrocorticia sp.]